MSYFQSLREIRNIQYSHHKKDSLENFQVDLDDFKSNPYTFLKWRFYLETSSLLLYFLVRTNVKPNHITLFYSFLGILTLFLLGLPSENKIFLYTGLFIAFTKTTIDACDGYIARLKNQKSTSGFALDPYGAYINTIGFQSGIGFYLAYTYENNIFLYLTFLIAFCYAIRFKVYAYSYILNEIIENKHVIDSRHPSTREEQLTNNSFISKLKKSNLKKIYDLLNNIFDDRARSVDLIILLFFVEINFDLKLIEYIFYYLIIRHLIIVFVSLFIYSNNEWLENKINKIR
jgi:hypothetical protein